MPEEIFLPKAVNLYYENLAETNSKELTRFIRGTFGNIRVRAATLKNTIVKTKGIVFDSLNTYRAFKEVSKDKRICAVVLTNRLIATENEFRRLHLRAAIFSEPNIISLTGIVEAPAKPKRYYLFKKQFEALRVWELKKDWLKEKFRGEFIDYGDERLTEILKGFISQALFFYILGNPFCNSRGCRLYNSHWQKDLIFSQIKKGNFCMKHKKILKQIKEELKNGG